MTAVFEVRARDDDASMRLTALTRDYFLAEVHERNLTASAHIGTYMSHGLAKLFTDMAAEWRGWIGSKTWSSFEGELTVSAQADKPDLWIALLLRAALVLTRSQGGSGVRWQYPSTEC